MLIYLKYIFILTGKKQFLIRITKIIFLYLLQGVMREEMHGMDLEILADEQCSDLVEFDKQDMICTRGRPPRYDSACNVSKVTISVT